MMYLLVTHSELKKDSFRLNPTKTISFNYCSQCTLENEVFNVKIRDFEGTLFVVPELNMDLNLIYCKL
jgi:hypothetical protein